MTHPRHEETPPSKTTEFAFPDTWTDASWGFNPALGQLSYTGNVLETTAIMGQEPETTISRRAMTFSIPPSLIISSYLSGEIDRHGLSTYPSTSTVPSYAPVERAWPTFHDISRPSPDLEMSLGPPPTFTRDVYPVGELPLIDPAHVPLLEPVISEAEDDDTEEDPSEQDYDPEYDGEGSDHTLTSACSGLCGAGAGSYCGCR